MTHHNKASDRRHTVDRGIDIDANGVYTIYIGDDHSRYHTSIRVRLPSLVHAKHLRDLLAPASEFLTKHASGPQRRRMRELDADESLTLVVMSGAYHESPVEPGTYGVPRPTRARSMVVR